MWLSRAVYAKFDERHLANYVKEYTVQLLALPGVQLNAYTVVYLAPPEPASRSALSACSLAIDDLFGYAPSDLSLSPLSGLCPEVDESNKCRVRVKLDCSKYRQIWLTPLPPTFSVEVDNISWLIQYYKVLYNLAPLNHADYFTLHFPLASVCDLSPIIVKPSGFTDHVLSGCFIYRHIDCWNTMPSHVRNVTSLASFKAVYV